jgi:hypothetical protein
MSITVRLSEDPGAGPDQPGAAPDDPGIAAGPSDPGWPPRARRRRLVIFLAVALIAVGAVGWFGVRPLVAPDCPPVAASPDYAPPNADTSFATLPVDLVGDYPSPDQVMVLGAWCGVVVVDLFYTVSADQYQTVDVVRGLDLATGQALWALDSLPDGSRLSLADHQGLSWEGKLALTALRSQLQSAEQYCVMGTDLVVLDLRSGAARVGAALEADCVVPGSGQGAGMTQQVVAYQDGIIVVDRWSWASGMAELTAAYRDTDLENTVWQRVGAAPPSGQTTSQRVLPGGWVRTSTGQYVGLADGQPSGWRQPGHGEQGWFSAGTTILQAVGAWNDQIEAPDPWLVALSGWTQASDTGPAWTYTPPPGWVIVGDLQDWRGSPLVAVTSDTVIVAEMRLENQVGVEATVVAIDLADGTRRWSAPYPFSSSDTQTVGRSSGDGHLDRYGPDDVQIWVIDDLVNVTTLVPLAGAALTAVEADQTTARQLVVVTSSTRIHVLDAATGAALADLPVDGRGPTTVHQCGPSVACVVIDNTFNLGKGSVVAVDLDRLQVTRTKPVGLTAVLAAPDRLLVMGRWDQQQMFMIAG